MKNRVRRSVKRVGIMLATVAFGVVGMSGPAMAAANLRWSNFPQVSSEDRIDVRTVSGAVASHSIRICLETANDVTWWKGLLVRSWNNGVLQELGAEGGGDRLCTTRMISDVKQLEFWKAKLFGVHTHMYSMPQSELYLRAGSEVTFRWVQDA